MIGTSLAVQWLRLCTSTAGGTGSIPGQGTKIPHAMQCNQKKEKGAMINMLRTLMEKSIQHARKKWIMFKQNMETVRMN